MSGGTASGPGSGVVGYGEGGLIAFYSAAADPRIDAALVSGYFGDRQRVWAEPIYRNVWGLLREFGDAEIATLIFPRYLHIVHRRAPRVEGPPEVGEGRREVAAPGRIRTQPVEKVRAEWERAEALGGPMSRIGWTHIGAEANAEEGPEAEADTGQPYTEALRSFLTRLTDREGLVAGTERMPTDRRSAFDPDARQKRQVRQIERHLQRKMRHSDRVRDAFLLDQVRRDSVEVFVEDVAAYRRDLSERVIGELDEPLLPPNARSRKVYDEEKWTGYEVVLDVWPDVFAWGTLCVPKGMEPGEKRPVIVCQHGLEGLPEQTITGDHPAYHNFASRLAERGFIVFAPHNLYRGGDRFRMLQRKANPIRASLFSIITPQHEQILNWLNTLPYVDGERIAFYGLSYGGKTAMRVPALLDGYCLSICSGDFNDWIRKNVTTHWRGSYMFTGEWEMPEFNLGRTFNYAEMSYLIAPRPFMVERGHRDTVALDEWVAYEYAKVRRLYDRLGIGDRTEIEYFNGPHEIHGQGTFEFLHKHLNWPAPNSTRSRDIAPGMPGETPKTQRMPETSNPAS